MSTRQRPSARAVVVVFALGVVGTLIPIIGWVIGGWLVVRADAWSPIEKALALVLPVVVLLGGVAAVVVATGTDLGPLPLLAAIPLTTSLSSAAGAIYLAARLGAHQRAAEAAGRS